MVEKGDKIEYKVLKKEPIIEPDNPAYEWGEDIHPGVSIDESVTSELWYQKVKTQFETFDHHRKSDLFRRYRNWPSGDEEVDKTIKLPDGSDYDFDNGNNMVKDLKDALTYRMMYSNDEKMAGWKIFEDLCGDYELSIVDNGIIIDRQKTMQRWLGWINESPELTTIDPLTNDVAVGIPENNGKIIYYFPQGLSNTEMLHYKVYEKMKGEVVKDEQFTEDIENAALYFAITQLQKHGTIKNPLSLLGPMMQIPIFEGQHDIIKTTLHSIVDKAIEIQEKYEEIDNLNKVVEIIRTKIPTFAESQMEEKTEEIGPRQLMNKVTDEQLFTKLQANRPPVSDKDKGGELWPKYRGGKFLLRFTTEAIDVLTKATGRKWGWPSESCETYNGCAGRGPCSDVKYGNCVIWIFEMDDDKTYPEDYKQWNHDETGRLMIRWGEGFSKSDNPLGFKVGIEPGGYPKRAVWTKNMIKAIGLILSDAGLFDYHRCVTPYKYQGYSDYARGGGTQIDYRGLRYRGPEGGFYDLTLDDVDLYLLLAQDPILNKFQASDVLQLGSEPSKLAMAQNQAIWAMPDRIRWLVRWSEQSGETERVINFLLQHDVIQPDLVATWVENLGAYAPNYRSTDSMNNIVYTIMNHPMLNDNLQRKLRANHDGFLTDGEFLGSFDEIIYLRLNLVNLFEGEIKHIPLIKAPTDILNEIVDKVLNNDFSKSATRNYLQESEMPQNIRYSEGEIRQLFYESYDYLLSIYALISAPNLTSITHQKIIESFTQWYSKVWSAMVNKYPQEMERLYPYFEKVLQAIQSSIVYPLREQTDWGYVDTPLGISYGEWPKEWRFQIEERQNLYSIRAVLDLTREYFPLSLEPFIKILMRNIRSQEVYNYLWNNKIKYNIPPYVFTQDFNNRNKESENAHIPNKWLTTNIFIEALKQCDNKSLGEIKYSYDDNEGNQILRTSVPAGAIKEILNSPVLIDNIGVETVAIWLRTPEEYNMFENFIFKKALGKLYKGSAFGVKIKKRKFKEYQIPTGEATSEDWMRWSNFNDRLPILQVAACGGDYGAQGLSVNPTIPADLQLRLILEPGADLMGNSKWRTVSEKYGGSYSTYLNNIVQNLIANPNASSATLNWCLDNYPEYKPLILANPSAPTVAINELINTEPLIALKNEGLSSKTLSHLANYIYDTLIIPLPANVNRFSEWFYTGVDDELYNLKRTQERRDIPFPLISWLSHYRSSVRHHPWVKYWRGGTSRTKMELPRDSNMAPVNPNTELPAALVDRPTLIKSPHVIYYLDFSKNDDGENIINNWETRFIEEVTVLDDGKIYVKGRRRPSKRWRTFEDTYQNIAEMYGWIPPEERVEESIKWTHDLILTTCDGELKDIDFSYPEWRLHISAEEVVQFPSELLKHPHITETIIIEIGKKIQGDGRLRAARQGAIMSTVTGNARIKLYDYFVTIDEFSLWTPKIISEFKQVLLGPEGFIIDFTNVKPTNLMRDIAIGGNETLLAELGYDDAYQLSIYREWIVRNFQDTLPIDFIYHLLKDPDVSAELRDRAMWARNKRIREFLEYLQKISEQEDPENIVMEAERV